MCIVRDSICMKPRNRDSKVYAYQTQNHARLVYQQYLEQEGSCWDSRSAITGRKSRNGRDLGFIGPRGTWGSKIPMNSETFTVGSSHYTCPYCQRMYS